MFVVQTMAFQAKLLSQFFKFIQYSYETFQSVAPILQSVIYSEINTVKEKG